MNNNMNRDNNLSKPCGFYYNEYNIHLLNNTKSTIDLFMEAEYTYTNNMRKYTRFAITILLAMLEKYFVIYNRGDIKNINNGIYKRHRFHVTDIRYKDDKSIKVHLNSNNVRINWLTKLLFNYNHNSIALFID